MSDRKKQSVFVIIGLIVAVFVGMKLFGSIALLGTASTSSEPDRSEGTADPRVVWQYHGRPLIERSLLNGYIATRPGLIIPADDTLYYSADRLVAFELKTGKIRWSLQPARMAPLCVTGQYVLTSAKNRTLNALSTADGKVLWSTDIPAGNFCWLKTHKAVVQACLQMGQLYQVCAFDLRTGKPLWQSAKLELTPQAADDGTISLTDSRARMVTALDGRTGKAAWTFKSPEKLLDILPGGPFLLAESMNTLYVLDRKTGLLKWKRSITGDTFVYSNEGALFMTLDREVLAALDPSSGRQA